MSAPSCCDWLDVACTSWRTTGTSAVAVGLLAPRLIEAQNKQELNLGPRFTDHHRKPKPQEKTHARERGIHPLCNRNRSLIAWRPRVAGGLAQDFALEMDPVVVQLARPAEEKWGLLFAGSSFGYWYRFFLKWTRITTKHIFRWFPVLVQNRNVQNRKHFESLQNTYLEYSHS